MKKYILYGLLIFFILAQFKTIDKTNPPISQEQDIMSEFSSPAYAEIGQLLKSACYDCHGNTTSYPWYTSIAPFSWWIKGHIDNGRKKLNFSKWSTYDFAKQKVSLEECIEVIDETRMPPISYQAMHADARLTKEERDRLVAFFNGVKLK